MASELQKQRNSFQPTVPDVLTDIRRLKVDVGQSTEAAADIETVRSLFPHTFGQSTLHFSSKGVQLSIFPLKMGVVLSGGQAPGGHNVIGAMFDALQSLNPQNTLVGFLNGPIGVVENLSKPLDATSLAPYRNTGGFDLIGSGRTKIQSPEQFSASLKTVQAHDLDGLVIIGGDDSNTNAALLAEYFAAANCKTKVIGVPKTIDGDLKNACVETSFGFDTATKIYSELIGNIARDALSAKKYTHFIKLMGRSASHIALECALQTHPNITLISEEKKSLEQITLEVADVIEARSRDNKNYSVVLIAEGLIEFIPEMKHLISELNTIFVQEPNEALEALSSKGGATFSLCPPDIQKQLLMDRDPHGNVQVSHIETERLIIHAVKQELSKREALKGFNPVSHFLGYEGRAGFPSNFDINYTHALGMTAVALVAHGFSGYMSVVSNLTAPAHQWEVGGVPITSFLHMEERNGKLKPVIQKALVHLKGAPYKTYVRQKKHWALTDDYLFPGPLQLWGPASVTEAITQTLAIERAQSRVY